MKLLSLTTFYSGSLSAFYAGNSNAVTQDYKSSLELLLKESTEFAASYIKNFNRTGLHAECIVANDKILQRKWAKENSCDGHNRDDLLIKQIKQYDPDILWIENLSIAGPDFIRTVRKESSSLKLIAGFHCAPADKMIMNNMRQFDLIFTCTPGLRDLYNSSGARAHLVYHGFDEDFLTRFRKSQTGDRKKFIFSGSLTTGGQSHNERIRLINRILESGIPLELYVNTESSIKVILKQLLHNTGKTLDTLGLRKVTETSFLSKFMEPVEKYSYRLKKSIKPPVFGLEMMELLSSSGIVLNFHIGASGYYAGNMRLFEATGCGSCLLTDNKSNIKELFDPGKEVVTYDNADDCIEKARWLISNPQILRNIAAEGQKRTLSSHLVRSRCETIKEILIEELRGK